MPWTCPKGCHKTEKNFEVKRDEYRTDCLVHWFKPNDVNLECPVSHKVYCGEDSDWKTPVCSVCETEVKWEGPGREWDKGEEDEN